MEAHARQLHFRVVHCSSFDREHRASELHDVNPHSRGWVSACFSDYPVEMVNASARTCLPPAARCARWECRQRREAVAGTGDVIELSQVIGFYVPRVSIETIRFLVHHHFIPSSVSISCGEAADDEADWRKCAFREIGFARFNNIAHGGVSVRELKTVQACPLARPRPTCVHHMRRGGRRPAVESLLCERITEQLCARGRSTRVPHSFGSSFASATTMKATYATRSVLSPRLLEIAHARQLELCSLAQPVRAEADRPGSRRCAHACRADGAGHCWQHRSRPDASGLIGNGRPAGRLGANAPRARPVRHAFRPPPATARARTLARVRLAPHSRPHGAKVGGVGCS
jgi:hypothetical protein